MFEAEEGGLREVSGFQQPGGVGEGVFEEVVGGVGRVRGEQVDGQVAVHEGHAGSEFGGDCGFERVDHHFARLIEFRAEDYGSVRFELEH